MDGSGYIDPFQSTTGMQLTGTEGREASVYIYATSIHMHSNQTTLCTLNRSRVRESLRARRRDDARGGAGPVVIH